MHLKKKKKNSDLVMCPKNYDSLNIIIKKFLNLLKASIKEHDLFMKIKVGWVDNDIWCNCIGLTFGAFFVIVLDCCFRCHWCGILPF
jgi:hypothetical protein